MNVVDFFKVQTQYWDSIQKCGFCWKFGAPLRESDLNEKELTTPEECCIQVDITNLTIRPVRTYDVITTFVTQYFEEYSFDLNILLPSVVDTNVYNEQPEHPISQSKWETILKPIYECLNGLEPFDFCDLLGRNIQIVAMNWISRIDYLDNNYTGWTIRLTLRDSATDSKVKPLYGIPVKSLNTQGWNGEFLVTGIEASPISVILHDSKGYIFTSATNFFDATFIKQGGDDGDLLDGNLITLNEYGEFDLKILIPPVLDLGQTVLPSNEYQLTWSGSPALDYELQVSRHDDLSSPSIVLFTDNEGSYTSNILKDSSGYKKARVRAVLQVNELEVFSNWAEFTII